MVRGPDFKHDPASVRFGFYFGGKNVADFNKSDRASEIILLVCVGISFVSDNVVSSGIDLRWAMAVEMSVVVDIYVYTH